TTTLPITVTVDAQAADNIELTTTSPTLTGPNDTTFNFDLTLNNGSAQDQTVSAKATGPQGWTVTTKLSDAQAASTVVKAGSTTTITVSATPPTDAPAGHTDLDVTVTAGAKSIPGKLGVDITGSFRVTLSTPNDLISAHGAAGSGTTQQIIVTATITPTGEAVTGDYKVTITANAPGENGANAATDNLDMTFTVETSP